MGFFYVLTFSAAVFLFKMQSGQGADIIGGKESVPHARPYMAALINTSRHSQFFCGGTLIKRKWVLTAAHCYSGTKEFIQQTKVILGAHSWIKAERKQQHFKIAHIFFYPTYGSIINKNDIMLLKLHKSAKIDRYVKTIQLPRTRSFSDVKAGTQCLVAGWGVTSNTEKTASETLHEVNVTVIERSICNDKQHYNSQPIVTKNMMCAGDMKGGKDSCVGDSGGPLICDGKQRGIVSFGKQLKCGDFRYPGVYTSLTKDYLTWIKKLTGVGTD